MTTRGTSMSTFDQFAATIWERDVETEHIQNALQVPPQDYSSIYYFHGQSGVGKSKLCDYTRRYIQTQLQAPYAMVNIDMSSALTEEQIIRTMYQALVPHVELTFPHYEAASAHLFNVTGDPVFKTALPGASSNSSLVQTIFELTAELGADSLDFAISSDASLSYSLIGKLASCIVEKILIWAGTTLNEQRREYILEKTEDDLRRFIDNLALSSPNEIRQNLSLYFMEDLKQSLDSICSIAEDQNYFLIFTIDAYEKRQHSAAFEYFVQQMLERSGSSTWFIFGTEPAIPQQETRVLTFHSYPINPFNKEHLNIYLQQQGVISEEDQEIIINASDGLPAAVQIMLEIYKNNNGHIDESLKDQGYNKLFNWYFSRHLTGVEQTVFSCLALFDYWNQEVFSLAFSSLTYRDTTFDDIINKSALVVKYSLSGHEDRYCLIDIVKKTILAQQRSAKDSSLGDIYRIKYNYEKAMANRYLEELKSNIIVDQELHEKIRYHCTAAFEAGVNCYSNKEEFEDISSWCTLAQRALSKRGLYSLKFDLTKLYIDLVEKRDGFKYDTVDEKNKRFRFQNMRDGIWAFRYSVGGQECVNLAGQYYTELLTSFGINCPYIPFATYLWGLTFYDVGDYETAYWLLKQSVTLETADSRGVSELNSSISAAVHNALGCIDMDMEHFKKAKKNFMKAQRIRSESDGTGKKNTCNNLSRLYFRWAQEAGRKDPNSEEIHQRLELSEKYLNDYEELAKEASVFSITDQYNITVRRTMLNVAKDCMLGYVGTLAPTWKEYFDALEDARSNLIKNPVPSAKPILIINHNIALMHALQTDFVEAKKQLSACITLAQKIYFDTDFQGQKGENKPAIRDLNNNLRAVTNYIEKNPSQLNPYDFLLQF